MLLTVGSIVRPHGVRGEVVVEIRTDEPALRFSAGAVLLTDPAEAGPLRVKHARPHYSAGRERLLVSFDTVQSRQDAEQLRGVLLQVDSAQIPPPTEPDEYHDHQLIGLTAVDQNGVELGRVVRIDHAPAHDLLVLERPHGRQSLIPFVAAIVPEVDLAAGRVVVTPPEGLLDL